MSALATIIPALLLLAQADDGPLEHLGRISDPSIRETSGIVASRTHPGVFWIQSDSGNPPVIRAIRRDGRVLSTARISVPNIDWEDIAADDAGNLYLAETGNNGRILPLRAIYRLREPDPNVPRHEVVPDRVTFYRFSRSVPAFDAESLYVAKGQFYVISKRNDADGTALFVFPDAPTTPGRSVVPTAAGRVPGFVEPATGAALSPDGRRLAVVSTTVTRVYARDPATDRLTLRGAVRYKERQAEAIAWDGPDLVLATEDGQLERIAATTWMETGKARP